MTDSNISRTSILERLRAASAEGPGLPDVPSYKIEGDATQNFCKNLRAYDGEVVEFGSREEAAEYARREAAKCGRVFSGAAGIAGDGIPADAAEAQTVSAAVVEAGLGVGETGSVWLTYDALQSPGAVLFSDHVFVLLDKSLIVDGMHTAYEKLNSTGWGEICYGSWFTGPSATADIEAVRVVGAQGPRALTVLLYETSV